MKTEQDPKFYRLRCYVERVMRFPRGRPNGPWLHFFTEPRVYSVWLRDRGQTTPEAFLAEQAALAREHRFGGSQQ